MMQTQSHAGGAESDLSKLLTLAADPKASKKIAEQLAELAEKREELRNLQAELAHKERDLSQRESKLAAAQAKAEETAAVQAKTEQTNREVTRDLNRREAELREAETTAFAARQERLRVAEERVFNFYRHLDETLVKWREQGAALERELTPSS
jgi:hypothetical protein